MFQRALASGLLMFLLVSLKYLNNKWAWPRAVCDNLFQLGKKMLFSFQLLSCVTITIPVYSILDTYTYTMQIPIKFSTSRLLHVRDSTFKTYEFKRLSLSVRLWKHVFIPWVCVILSQSNFTIVIFPSLPDFLLYLVHRRYGHTLGYYLF